METYIDPSNAARKEEILTAPVKAVVDYSGCHQTARSTFQGYDIVTHEDGLITVGYMEFDVVGDAMDYIMEISG